MEYSTSLLMLLLLPAVGALAVYAGRKKETLLAVFAAAAALLEFLLAFANAASVLCGTEYYFKIKGFMLFGLHLKMDAFRAIFIAILTFMWLAAIAFSPEYLKHHARKMRYYLFTLLTLSATIGVFLAADLLTLYLFFEIMSFTSYVWVAEEETKEALKAAETYLAVAILGGMVMLMGLFLLYGQTKTMMLSELRVACAAADSPKTLLVAGCLMLFGFGAKAGMFPLHIWLPKAHPVAPAPASALLSGGLTKCGVFGVILLSGSVLPENEVFGWLLLALGAVTMFLGALLGVFSINIKRTLACSSVSQIGFILVGLGVMDLVEENAGVAHGVFLHMVNHSMIKLILFLLAGVIYRNLNTLDLTEIQGFGKRKLFFGTAFASSALALGGIPLFSGYISKMLLHEAIVEAVNCYSGPKANVLRHIEWVFLISGGMTIAYLLKLFVALFFEGDSEKGKRQKGEYLSLPTKCLLALPVALLPVMGMLPEKIMLPLAKMTEKFFYGKNMLWSEEAIQCFSLENLSGAMISCAIGLALYFGVVRTWMVVKKDGRTIYVDRLPKWMDFEKLIYRPLLARLVPFLCALICRLCDKFVEGIAALCSLTFLSEKRPREDLYTGGSFPYLAGRAMDFVVFLLNHTIRRRKPIQKSYVKIFAVAKEEMSRTARLIARSVSYGLLLSCIGLLLTMIYLLLV